jgi:hypothetical protein
MIQPKYNPEEALQRAKLMMGYDTRKTLKENKETLEEQTWWKSMLSGGATGAAVGAVAGPMAIPGAVVGGILGLVIDLSSGTASKDKITQLIQACSKNNDELGKKTMSDDQLDELSDKLYTSMKGAGTEEDDIKDVFIQIQSVPDLCALVDNYKDNYGDLVEWLDGDLDGDEEWRDYVALPLRKAIRASNEASKKTAEVEDKCKTNPNDPACKKVVKKGGGYKPCTGTYQFGCQSDVIAKVQGCLGGLSQDGKFGPKTKAKLSAKGFTTFTDSDVEKICSAAETKLTNDVESSDLTQGGESNVTPAAGQGVDPNAKDGIS